MSLSCHCPEGPRGGQVHVPECGYYRRPIPEPNKGANVPEEKKKVDLRIPEEAFRDRPIAREREDMKISGFGEYVLAMAGDSLSQEDLERYLDVVKESLAVHIDRDRIRKGLWKTSSARDQANMVRVKIERVMHILSQDAITKEELDEVVKEGHDIINYSVFFVRLAKGRGHV